MDSDPDAGLLAQPNEDLKARVNDEDVLSFEEVARNLALADDVELDGAGGVRDAEDFLLALELSGVDVKITATLGRLVLYKG